MNIILFGFMGTGKSVVGRSLARRLDLQWMDMDEVIQEREGRTIEEIFEKSGEPYFRKLERFLVQELVQKSGFIVSTGGGVVLDQKNVEDFEKWGLCICLSANPEAIFDRVRHRTDRPLLKGPDPMKKIKELLEFRRPFYQRISNQIDTTDKSIHDIVETILKLVNDKEEMDKKSL